MESGQTANNVNSVEPDQDNISQTSGEPIHEISLSDTSH